MEKELEAYLYLFIYRVDINCAQAGNNNYLWASRTSSDKHYIDDVYFS